MFFFNNLGKSTITVSHDDPDVEGISVEITVGRKKANFTINSYNLINTPQLGFTGDANEDLVIPSTFVGNDGVDYTVTSIDKGAFVSKRELRSVVLPNTITSIGMQAFTDCTSLTSITLPNTITTLNDGLFENCTSLTETPVIPESVISIGERVFHKCTALETVDIPDTITTIGKLSFAMCASLTSVKLPIHLTSISTQLFVSCKSLTSITIPDTVRSIGYSAFAGCNLTSVTIPEGVSEIEDGAFDANASLREIYIPSTVSKLNSILSTCPLLEYIRVNHDNNGIDNAPWGGQGAEVVWLKAPIATSCRLDGFDPEKTYNEGDVLYLKVVPLPEGSRFPLVGDDNTFRPFTSLGNNSKPEHNNEILDFESTTSIVNKLTLLSAGTANLDYGFITDNDYNSYTETVEISVAAVQHYQVTFDDDCNEVSTYPGPVANEDDKSGAYRSGRRVKISCKESAIEHFVQWSCDDTSLVFEDKTNPTTYFIMPDHDIVIDHTFVTHNVTLSGAGVGATGNGEYIPGNTVTITPGTKEGFEFAGYTCTNTTVQTELNDETPGTFTMPEADIEVVVIWEEIVYTDFTVKSTNRAMIGYTDNTEELVIPSTFKAEDGEYYKVVGIDNYAFQDCTTLTTVTIPNSVTNIDSSAFQDCTSLTTIDIPNSVATIHAHAFIYCNSITTINVDNTADAISSKPWGATNATVNWLREPKDFTVTTANRAMVGYTGAVNEELVIPSTFTGEDSTNYKVVSIGDNAFNGCNNLKSVTIPEGVTIIGTNTFQNCTSLSSITIPDTVTSIGNSVFRNCNALTSITIPSVKTIRDYSFQKCTSLKSVTIPNSVTTIGTGAFDGCTLLSSITIPNSVTEISWDAFRGCSSLTSVTIPNTVTSISNSAFNGCTSLKSITIPNSVTSIGNNAFKNCTSLTSITIPNTVTSFGSDAFNGCNKLTTIDIHNSVKTIGEAAFYSCTNLTTINIDNTLNAITGSPWGAPKAEVNWLDILDIKSFKLVNESNDAEITSIQSNIVESNAIVLKIITEPAVNRIASSIKINTSIDGANVILTPIEGNKFKLYTTGDRTNETWTVNMNASMKIPFTGTISYTKEIQCKSVYKVSVKGSYYTLYPSLKCVYPEFTWLAQNSSFALLPGTHPDGYNAISWKCSDMNTGEIISTFDKSNVMSTPTPKADVIYELSWKSPTTGIQITNGDIIDVIPGNSVQLLCKTIPSEESIFATFTADKPGITFDPYGKATIASSVAGGIEYTVTASYTYEGNTFKDTIKIRTCYSYTLNILGSGTGSIGNGSHFETQEVEIYAGNTTGKNFLGWVTQNDSTGKIITYVKDRTNPRTTITVPAFSKLGTINLYATWSS